jgi:hypothetical protein
MLEAIWTGLLVALLGWIASVLWNNRSRLSLLWVSLRPSGEVRVSVASLLRVQDDDRYVVVHSPYRPDSYGPLGGVVKYLPAARPALDRLRFREEPRVDQRMRNDLRGFLPARALPGFVRWFASAANSSRNWARSAIRNSPRTSTGSISRTYGMSWTARSRCRATPIVGCACSTSGI